MDDGEDFPTDSNEDKSFNLIGKFDVNNGSIFPSFLTAKSTLYKILWEIKNLNDTDLNKVNYYR